MRPREKLTLEEKVAMALELIKRERSLEEIQNQFRVSHTTAYKVRNLFLDGGRRALTGETESARSRSLEARVQALEEAIGGRQRGRRRIHGGSAA